VGAEPKAEASTNGVMIQDFPFTAFSELFLSVSKLYVLAQSGAIFVHNISSNPKAI